MRRFLIGGDRGASAYIEFLIIVVPFIAILFTMFEMANISHTRMSMARGVQEALIKTSMSPLDMGDPDRWADLGEYVISQGNGRVQYGDVEFLTAEGDFDTTMPPAGTVLIFAEASSVRPPGSPVAAMPGGGAVVSLGDGEPPIIRLRAKYGYRYVTGFVWLLYDAIGEEPPSIAMESGLVSVNEHPDYERKAY